MFESCRAHSPRCRTFAVLEGGAHRARGACSIFTFGERPSTSDAWTVAGIGAILPSPMDREDTTTGMPQDEPEEGLGTRFYLKLAGGLAAIGALLLVGLLIFWRALYAWGFFGALLALAVVLVIVGWIYDRRNPHP
jgi:hypothetical protein